jgi:hypothetical protein
MKTSMFTGIVLRLLAIKIISAPSFGDDGMSEYDDSGLGDYTADGATAAATVVDEMAGDDSWD